MNKIHMQIEQTRQSASRMQHSAIELSESCDSLDSARRRLSGSWRGGGSNSFDRDFRNCLRELGNQIDDLDRLVIRMQREIDQWEAEDNDGLAALPGGFTFFAGEQRLQYGLQFGWHLITGNVIGGIYTLYQVGQHWVTDNQEHIDQVILRSDETIDTYLRGLLGGEEGSTQRMHISLDGEFTIPGAEVGVPGSFVLGKGKDFELIRNPNGTYTLYLEDSSKYGLEHDFTPNARTRIGSQEYKVDPTAEVGASVSPISYAAFTFDPKKQGDLTKMAALVGSVGIGLPGALSMLPSSTPAGPALYMLRDNLTEVGFAMETSAEGELSQNALVKLAGVDVEGHVKQGGSMIKEDGKWKVASNVEIGADLDGQVLGFRNGVEGDINLQSIVDVETGQASSVVTVTLKGEAGAGLDPSVLNTYVPDAETALSMNVEANQFNEYQITYRLDQPAETVRDMISGPEGFSITPLIANSSIQVSTSQGTSATGGIGGEIAIGGGQELGADLGGEVTRSSQQTIYTYP